KTGTNTEFRGVAFAGFTPYYTGVVWIGNDEEKPLGEGVTGSGYAAPLWQAFMAKIHEQAGLEDRDILDKGAEELGLVQKRVCDISGKLAGPYCPQDKVIVDWFQANSIPTEECDQHGIIEICKDSGKFPGPYCPEESITKRSVYFLEDNSPYRQLSEAQLRQWIPGAYFGFDNMGQIKRLDINNPDQRGYFCDVHTEPIRDNVLDDLKDFFEGLIPGKDKDKDKDKDNIEDENQDEQEDNIEDGGEEEQEQDYHDQDE
ncbi:MAG TPA: hypothetical protein VFD57_05300, partial [Clostridia bacterium]|nr:hypothetical protein [Clostridia bacterium]